MPYSLLNQHVSYAADECDFLASPIDMNELTTFTHLVNSSDGPIITPCTVTCINLQAMGSLVQKRLSLQYKTFYTMMCYGQNPTPDHLGTWVQIAGVGTLFSDGSREWIPAQYFLIDFRFYPN